MKSTILCYHKVGSFSQEGRSLNVEPRLLTDHAAYFSRRKAAMSLACDLPTAPRKNLVCFTFDDAYLSTLENAPEILERFELRGSFYAVSSKVGGSSDWDGSMSRPLATIDHLAAAAARGHEVGNHSATHRRLGDLSKEEQVFELRACHALLLDHGIDCKSACFPYGDFNQATLEGLQRLGYKVGLSLRKGNLPAQPDYLALPRIVVGYADKLPKLLYKINIRPLLRQIGI